MRIAVFYPKTNWASWNDTEGIAAVLRRAGHSVISAAIPQQQITQQDFDSLCATLPTIEQLSECDAILLSGPEHLVNWIQLIYRTGDWQAIRVPKANLFHESADRSDGGRFNFDEAFWLADQHFFPAAQDAEFYDQEQFAEGRSHWLPFGVDTEIFRAEEDCCGTQLMPQSDRAYNLAFIGLTYGYRQKYLQALGQYNHPAIHIGQCVAQDISGPLVYQQASMLASNYRQIQCFFSLPSLSRLLVSKVFEVLACGTFMLCPRLPAEGGAVRNLKLFNSGEHLIYYTPANLAETAALLTKWSSDKMSAERERIAQSGCELVHREYSLQKRLQRVLETLKVDETITA